MITQNHKRRFFAWLQAKLMSFETYRQVLINMQLEKPNEVRIVVHYPNDGAQITIVGGQDDTRNGALVLALPKSMHAELLAPRSINIINADGHILASLLHGDMAHLYNQEVQNEQ